MAAICHPASLGLSTSHVVQYSVLKGGNQKKILYLPPLPANLPGQFTTRDEALEYLKATDHVKWHLTQAPNNMRKCPSHKDENMQKLSKGQIILACDYQR